MIIQGLEVTISGWKVSFTDLAVLVPFADGNSVFLNLIAAGHNPVGMHFDTEDPLAVVHNFSVW